MHVLMIASSTAVMSTRIWMHAPYVVHCGIRSGERTLGYRGGVSSQEESSCQGHMVDSYNSTSQASV
jgi:hypothetical protein